MDYYFNRYLEYTYENIGYNISHQGWHDWLQVRENRQNLIQEISKELNDSMNDTMEDEEFP